MPVRPVVLRFLGDSGQLERTMGRVERVTGKLGGLLAGGLVASAGAAAAGLFKLGESFDAQFDKIRVSTGKTGEALSALEGSFKNVLKNTATDFDTAGDAVATLSQRLGLTGKPLETMAKNLVDVSRITNTDFKGNIDSAIKSLQNFSVPVAQQTKVLDELFRASQVSGVSFADLASQLASYGVTLRALGFNMTQSTTVLAGLGKAGVDVSDVMPALSKSLATAAKHGLSAQTVYRQTLHLIKDTPSATKAAAIAMEVFGAKAGPRFAALIREGKFSFDSLGESIASGKDTIAKAAVDTADFSEKWQIFKNRVLVGLQPVATKVFDGVGKAMDKLGPIADRVGKRFGEEGLSGAFKQLGDEWLKLDPKIKVATAAITALGVAAAIAWVAALGPIPQIILALGTLGLALITLYENSKPFRTFVDGIGEAFMVSVRLIQAGIIALIKAYNSIPFLPNVGVPGEGATKLGPAAEAYIKAHPNSKAAKTYSGKRAAGGPVSPWSTYLVGEKGPELLTMGASGGYVHANNARTVNIYMPPGSNGQDVVAAIQRYERRNGKGWRNQ